MAQEKFERFGNYILLEKLASGGMAEIYLSKKLAAEGVQKFVAVKRILSQHSTSEDFIRMFKDEAKIAVNLSHSNVVSIYDFGTENQQLYLVMDYVEGKNLRQILNRLKQNNRHFSVSHIAYATKLIAAGLDHAHRLIDATTGRHLNIIHRDMSPQNVMVSFEGEVKIIDFGIAKSTTQEENTRVGTLKGKFGYMSPEQVDGMEVDARTDIFALGIMLWEMLSEQRLFLTNNEMTTLRKIRDCKIPSLREMDPNIPVELEKIVNKALARSKAQRYQTAADLQKDLQSFLNRYNPDFSSHDFSEFIKDLYAEEIIEARNRQVAYSKIDVPHVVEPQREFKRDPEQVTQSMTFSHNNEKMNFVDLEIKRNATASATARYAQDSSPHHLTLSASAKSKMNTRSGVRTPPENTKSYNITGIKTVPSQDPSPIVGLFIVVVAGVIGAFAFLNETQPRLVANQCQIVRKYISVMNCYEAGKTTLATLDAKLRVKSQPDGALIYVNNKSTGVKTPGEVDLKDLKSFTLAVAKSGYRSETRSYSSIPTDTTIHFDLESIPSGTLYVRLIGGKAYMNGNELTNGQKITVEANKPIDLKVSNPITHAVKVKTVTVRPNEVKEIVLAP